MNLFQGRDLGEVTLRKLLCILAYALAVACAPLETRTRLDRPLGEAFASAGDLVLRVNMEEDLPNAFGRADVFGRTRDRGFTEIRYMGTNGAGLPVFRRRDVTIYSNEITLSRSGVSVATATAQHQENTATATGVAINPTAAQVGILPSDTVELVLDPTVSRRITVGAHGIDLVDFNSAGVRYRVF